MPGACRDLRERPPLAVGPQAAHGGEAHEAADFLGLHELGDRRADLVGEVGEQREPFGRVGARTGRRARRRRDRRVIDGRRSKVVGAHVNCPGASTGSPADRSLRAHRQQRRGRFGEQRLARRLRRRPRRIEHRHAQLDTGRRIPQQRGPGAVPPHRERQRARTRSGTASTVTGWPSQSGGKPGSRSITLRLSRTSTFAQRRQEPRRVAHRDRPRAARPRDRRARRAGAPSGARGSPSCAQPVAASSSKPQSSSAATTAGLARDARSRSARAASTLLADRHGQLGLHARARAGVPNRARPRRRRAARARRRPQRHRHRAESPTTARNVVRCGTGNSSASSIGPSSARRSAPGRASPLITIAAVVSPAAHAPGGRDATSAGTSVDPQHRAVELDRARAVDPHDERDRQRRRRAVLDLDHHDRRAPAAAAPYAVCATSPPGTRTEVSTIGRRTRPQLMRAAAPRRGCASGRRHRPTSRARARSRPRRVADAAADRRPSAPYPSTPMRAVIACRAARAWPCAS